VSSNYFRYLWRKLRRWLQPQWRPEPEPVDLPTALQDLALEEQPLGAARVLEGRYGRRRMGYLLVWRDRLALQVKRIVKAKVRSYYFKELEDVYVGEDTLLDRLYLVARGRPYVISFFKGREPAAADVAGIIAAGQAKP
jgi:hypothetical protein